jgi:SAM-dependent methyltransferase
MSVDLGYVPTRQLVDEIVRRVPLLLRKGLRRKRAAAPPASPATPAGPFAVLSRPGRPPLELDPYYRSSIKRSWAAVFWPVEVLLQLHGRSVMGSRASALATDVKAARTLPVPLAEIAACIAVEAERLPEHVARTGRTDAGLGVDILEVIPTDSHVADIASYHRANAKAALSRAGLGSNPAAVRALEVGCGSAFTTFALGAIGVAQSIGLDLGVDRGSQGPERLRVRRALLGERANAAVRLDNGDAHALPYRDEVFDLVHHSSALEHLTSPGTAFREAFRVLRPGGVVSASVDPWFGPQGGHSLCTLDCAWAHVRLAPDEFASYVATYRPHEADAAVAFYRDGFQTPRLTIGDVQRLAVEAGFVIESWQETPAPFEDHAALLTPPVLEDCRREAPAVTPRDLLTASYAMRLRKPRA